MLTFTKPRKLILDGSEKEIVLRPKDHTWRGIYVNNAAELSLINNTRIDSVQNFQHEGINLTGGVNFYKSDVEIINTKQQIIDVRMHLISLILNLKQ